MLDGYIDFVASLFPSISTNIKESAKESILQFYTRHKEFPCFTDDNIADINQGDILKNIPFRIYNQNGEEMEYINDGLVISNSCDIENDDQILIAPFFPIQSLNIDITALKNNIYYKLIYFPDKRYADKVADFSLMSPFPKKLLLNKISTGKVTKLFSLNLIGYYLLISKITVHLLRPEDSGVQKCRDNGLYL
ncbi:hypothetical protein AGMMS50212_07070 [Spirochaetia bacterium]|nr:hypothetical protein AGMMS50212_07040 [Spirochaetia bacterium]GHV83367.1 hypothetical protein AGMMS50212_07070 [Spirochaetia bacterium]